MFMTSSQLVHNFFTTCSCLVWNLFIWELILHDLFTIVHNLFKTSDDLFTNFSQHVHNVFMTCSWLVHNLFTTFSQYFTTCSWLVSELFRTCSFEQFFFPPWSQLVHDLVTTCSWLLHDLFKLSKLVQNLFMTFSWLFYNFFIIFSQLVHNSLRTCSFVYYFFMTCSQLVHILYLSCPVSTTCSHLCHNFSKILSPYFHKSVFVRFPKFKITLILILKRARYCQPPACLLNLASFQDNNTSSPKNH